MPAVLPDVTTTYRVEVSGWDVKSEFFVEKAALQWSEEGGKQILLTHSVEGGALLFLRLLDPENLERVHPVAYQAGPVRREEPGQYRVKLLPAHLRLRRV